MRARIGIALTAAGGKPRSSITAAIGIETFIVSGLPQASAAPSRNSRASSDVRAAHAALVGELEDALGARVERPVHRMAEAGQALARLADRRGHRAATAAGLLAGGDPRLRGLEQVARTPRPCRG